MKPIIVHHVKVTIIVGEIIISMAIATAVVQVEMLSHKREGGGGVEVAADTEVVALAGVGLGVMTHQSTVEERRSTVSTGGEMAHVRDEVAEVEAEVAAVIERESIRSTTVIDIVVGIIQMEMMTGTNGSTTVNIVMNMTNAIIDGVIGQDRGDWM